MSILDLDAPEHRICSDTIVRLQGELRDAWRGVALQSNRADLAESKLATAIVRAERYKDYLEDISREQYSPGTGGVLAALDRMKKRANAALADERPKTSETKTPIEQVGDNAGEILGSRVGSSRPLSPGGGSEEPGSSSDANQNFYLALALGYNELAKHATREGDKVYWRLMRTEAVKKLSYDPFAISEKP
jgi:hypothetical protein